jgi:hypothetical protein
VDGSIDAANAGDVNVPEGRPVIVTIPVGANAEFT